MPLVIYRKASRSPWQFTPLSLGFFAGGTRPFKFFFVCKQCSHLNKTIIGGEILFYLSFKNKSFPIIQRCLTFERQENIQELFPLARSEFSRKSYDFIEVFLETILKFPLFLLFFKILLHSTKIISVIHVSFVFRVFLSRHLINTY